MRYEISYIEDGATSPTAESFNTLEEAIERANEVGAATITDYETGYDYSKCWWCEEWMPSEDINDRGLCERCRLAIWSRGEEI